MAERACLVQGRSAQEIPVNVVPSQQKPCHLAESGFLVGSRQLSRQPGVDLAKLWPD
jgi:hypothetical protein